jgi:uncharacterized cupredoxin-like copper-binding protein
MTVRIESSLAHAIAEGDGVRGSIISSRGGLLASAQVHKSQAALGHAELAVKAGETVDFVVDIGGSLNSDEFTWEIAISEMQASGVKLEWNAKRDFHGPATAELDPWAQLAQVLFSANEFVFVD